MKKLLLIVLSPFTLFAQNNEAKLIKKAAKIHAAVLTVDTHADAPIKMMQDGFDVAKRHSYEEEESQIDFPRMKEGGMDAMFFAVYLAQGKRTPEATAEAKEKALNIFDKIHEAVKQNPEVAELAVSSKDAYRIQKAGKRAIFIGMENGWPVGKDLANLKQYYDLGLRYITLSHSFNNDICDSSGDPEGAEFNGLSPYGETVVKEMNRLGIMVDISHVSDSSFYDVIKLSKVPVIASHSSCRTLSDHKRNMTDDMIKTLAQHGGVIQINFVPDFVKKPTEQHSISMKELKLRMMRNETTAEERKVIDAKLKALKKDYPQDIPTVKEAVDHIEYVIKLVGIDHVGIGMDMDGGGLLQECKDVSQIGNLTLEMVRRGYSKKDIAKIWGGNVMRVLDAVEKGAEKK